jgi:hypothetical protein
MGMTPLEKAKRQLRHRPVYFVVRKMMDPASGEEVGCLVPLYPVDNRSMRERGFRVGVQLRAELKQARNPKFNALAHVLGGWLADNTELFAGNTQHDALKLLQELSGIGVVVERFEIPGWGNGTRTIAESLNFDDMDEGRFRELWDGGIEAHGNGGWLGWLRLNVWGALSAEQTVNVERLIEKPQ